jgi:DNA-binding HxlR family transcriptional regulator
MEKALEICRNLKRTIDKMGNKNQTLGNSTLRDNTIFNTYKVSKSILERQLKELLKKHNIKKEEL